MQRWGNNVNEARNGGHLCAETVPTEAERLASLLRVAEAQWPHKSPEDQEIERRFIERDLAAFEAARIGD
jgi:hypothetical protein